MRIALSCIFLLLAIQHSQAEEIVPAEGLSQAQATQIARAFYRKTMSGCGGIREPTLQGELWLFPVVRGYAATRLPDPIVVHRFTGKATYIGMSEMDINPPKEEP